ncbi:MAG TPA: hydrogen gas-evolving membrane-bound hydrogenase subunit E, partial [Gemmatimonadaceae bacterium]|nr:hydrogen gas-evolving membrane-bound hydrogenase subunit E [Gemmatimonadaceae bacterium]
LGLRWLPKRLEIDDPQRRTLRARSRRARDIVLAAISGTGMAGLVYAILTRPSAEGRISPFYVQHALPDGGGRNIVNVILVDFRGFDTLGETTVIALASVIAWSLLGPRLGFRRRSGAGAGRAPFALVFASPVFFWLLAALSVVVLLRGHNQIGGGFVGGLMAALAFAIIGLAQGLARARARLRWHPLALAGAGLLLAAASGLPGLAVYGDFLRHVWLEAELLGVPIKQGTTLLFDLGVYLAVLGTVLAFFFGLSREGEP